MTSICSTATHTIMLCNAPVDWTATGTMLSGIGTVIGAVGVIYGAIEGFNKWRQQKLAERRMVLAEQILALTYKLRDVMRSIRSPASFKGEHDEAEKILLASDTIYQGMDSGQKQRLIMAQIILTRIHAFTARWDELNEILPLAKAIFGDEVENALNTFWKQRNAVNAAVRTYASLKYFGEAQSREEAIKRNEMMQRLESTFWEGAVGPEQDAVVAQIDKAVVELESSLLPIIRDAGR